MRVLVCEDNLIVALDLQEMLREIGHTTIGISVRSTNCFDLALRQKPDVVLVDLNLADGRTGLGLVRALSEHGIPAIIVSGEIENVAEDPGAAGWLEKPTSATRLRDALAKI